MSKKNILRAGALLAGACSLSLVFAGAAQAQRYDEDSYTNARGETVIVRPHRDVIREKQHLGSIAGSGYLNPVELTASRRVGIGDIDLSRSSGWRRLRIRINDTARDICYELSQTDPRSYDRDEYASCVRKATDDAMRQVMS